MGKIEKGIESSMVYLQIKELMKNARKQVSVKINNILVQTYQEIGKIIIEDEQKNNERAEYGKKILKELSNLQNMRQFYLIFQKSYALSDQLTWTHYRLLMRVENENARNFYIEECIKSNWSTRQLERQITTLFYERLLSSKKDKEKVSKEIYKLEPQIKKAEDIIKDSWKRIFICSQAKKNYF